MPYFSGQGKLLVASISSGVAQAFRYVGNVPELTFDLETQVQEHRESFSGTRSTDYRMTTDRQVNVSFALEEFSKENLALAFYGTAATVSGSTVTGETLPSGLVAGDIVRLAHPDVSSVVVVDSAGTPATLSAGSDYEVWSAKHGTLKILDPSGLTQPFKANYTYGAYDRVPFFGATEPEVWLRFEGLNTANSNKHVLVELYKVRVDPAGLSAISDDFGRLAITGIGLYDATKEADTALGQFGRMLMLT